MVCGSHPHSRVRLERAQAVSTCNLMQRERAHTVSNRGTMSYHCCTRLQVIPVIQFQNAFISQ
jgi:hypothetical protein